MEHRKTGRKRERDGSRVLRVALSLFVSSLPVWLIILQSQRMIVDEYRLASYENVKLYKSASNVSTLLAYQQSFGFFDDIPDPLWQRIQNQVRFTPLYSNRTATATRGLQQSHAESFTSSTTVSPGWWYAHNLPVSFHGCFNMERVGGLDDGPKWTCDPHRLRTRPSCLIYSVGSAGQYQWERGLVERLGTHCEIHVFE